VSGKVGRCARDLVGECRRCGRIVCRVCHSFSRNQYRRSDSMTDTSHPELYIETALPVPAPISPPPTLSHLPRCPLGCPHLPQRPNTYPLQLRLYLPPLRSLRRQPCHGRYHLPTRLDLAHTLLHLPGRSRHRHRRRQRRCQMRSGQGMSGCQGRRSGVRMFKYG